MWQSSPPLHARPAALILKAQKPGIPKRNCLSVKGAPSEPGYLAEDTSVAGCQCGSGNGQLTHEHPNCNCAGRLTLPRELIRSIRKQRVVLDSDLAALYGVQTKMLNRAVKRNANRFPPEFVFRLEPEEAAALRCQFGTLKAGRGQHCKYAPSAFTEHGALMASTVLNSPRAVAMGLHHPRLRQIARRPCGQRRHSEAAGGD